MFVLLWFSFLVKTCEGGEMYVGWEGWRDGGLTAGPGILMRLPLHPPLQQSLCGRLFSFSSTHFGSLSTFLIVVHSIFKIQHLRTQCSIITYNIKWSQLKCSLFR